MIEVNEHLSLGEDEVVFTASHGGGPGGQNVNKVATRVTLWFDLAASPSLDDHQRRLIQGELAGRIGKDGRLRVTSRRHRTQAANRAAVRQRLVELLREALIEKPKRKATRVPRRARRKRLREKRHRSAVKRLRSERGGEE